MGSAVAMVVCTLNSGELWFLSPTSSPELVVVGFLDLDEMEFPTSFNLHCPGG